MGLAYQGLPEPKDSLWNLPGVEPGFHGGAPPSARAEAVTVLLGGGSITAVGQGGISFLNGSCCML